MLLKCQINKNTNKIGFLHPTKWLKRVMIALTHTLIALTHTLLAFAHLNKQHREDALTVLLTRFFSVKAVVNDYTVIK